MFTGLVEAVGTLVEVRGSSPKRLLIRSNIPTSEVALGDSVAIDGCCLTVVAKTGETLEFEAATETLALTTLGNFRAGRRVHLERALRVGDRLDGHMVAGHVDGVGILRSREQRASALYLGVEAPESVSRLTVDRGSITLDGVSLTVTEVKDRIIWVGLIPHTLSETTLGELKIGDPLNLEADMIARYVAKLMTGMEPPQGGGLTVEYLKGKGFA
jgi:riboflavin synthase